MANHCETYKRFSLLNSFSVISRTAMPFHVLYNDAFCNRVLAVLEEPSAFTA